jgi:hypothetical protein
MRNFSISGRLGYGFGRRSTQPGGDSARTFPRFPSRDDDDELTVDNCHPCPWTKEHCINNGTIRARRGVGPSG